MNMGRRGSGEEVGEVEGGRENYNQDILYERESTFSKSQE